MKNRIVFLLLSAIFIVSCSKSENSSKNLANGDYKGHFTFRGENYDYSLNIDSDNYDEPLITGQTLSKDQHCLSFGTYSLFENKLIFHLTSFKYDNTESCLMCKRLPGVYSVLFWNRDSIVFERGANETHIRYYLKKSTN